MKRIFTIFLFLIVAVSAMAQAGRVKELEKTVIEGTTAPADTNRLWLDGNVDGIPKLWNPYTGQYDPVKFEFEVNNVDSVSSVKFPLGSIIRTKGFSSPGDGGAAVYLVQEDSIQDYSGEFGVIDLPTGNYAVLQPTEEGGYKPEWFGARVNDNFPDSIAFEKAVTWVKTPGIANYIQCSSGSYNDPYIRVYQNNDGLGNYDLISIKIKGVKFPYTNISSINQGTNFVLGNTNIPGIILQSNRGSEITDIHFQGTSNAPFYTKDSILSFTEADYARFHSAGRNNPYAGIVIDPYLSSRAANEQYPGASSLYTHSFGGSSMINIERCGFVRLDVCVAEVGTTNGDNIRMEDFSVEAVRRVYVTYSSQSRQGSLNNAYVRFCQTFFYNDGIGAPPSFRNISGAGFVREVFFASTQESKITMDNSQWESLWRIGRVGGFPASFIQTQFKFEATSEVPQPQAYLTASNGPVSFEGCTIVFFANCTYRSPFSFYAPSGVHFKGCHFQGGVTFQPQLGSQAWNEIVYENCTHNCWGQGQMNTGSFVAYGVNRSNGRFASQGGKFTYSSGTYYQNEIEFMDDNMFNLSFVGSLSITQGTEAGEGYFLMNRPDSIFRQYDGLVSLQTRVEDLSNISMQQHAGFVSELVGDTVKLRGMPIDFTYASPFATYKLGFMKPMMFVWGDITAGNDTIKNVFARDNNAYGSTMVGQKLYISMTQFPANTYITQTNTSAGWIRVSNPATANAIFKEIITVPYKQIIYSTSTSLPNNTALKEGAIIYNSNPEGDNWTKAVCTVPGIQGTANPYTIETEGIIITNGTETNGDIATWNITNNRYEPGVNTPSQQNVTGVTNPNGGTNTIQAGLDSLALTYSLFPAITYTPNDSIPIDTVLQSFPITSRLDGDTLRQITYTVTHAPTIDLNLRVLIWDGSTYTAAFSGTIPAGSRSVSVSGAVAVATDERIFPEILTDSGASGLDLELKFQKP